MGQRIIELTGIKVLRNRQLVLDIEGLTVSAGEIVAVAGPNGAGKSTLLQLVNMLLPYQEGSLKLFGLDAADREKLEIVRRQSSMMFQDTLLVNGTVYDNVALPLKFRGYSSDEISERVMGALRTFRCEHLAERQARQLSGGEGQRVGLARALVYEPKLLLLDEPLAALDTAARTGILNDLKQVAIDNSLTVLMVSHNFNDVLYFADRVIVLAGGRIVQDDRPEVVLRRPVSRQVADLVDMDNVLPCRVETRGPDTIIHLSADIAFNHQETIAPGSAACCLPGDAIYIHNESMAARQPFVVVNGKVVGIIPGIGAYKVQLQTTDLSLTLRAPRELAAGLAVGSEIRAVFNPNEVQVVY